MTQCIWNFYDTTSITSLYQNFDNLDNLPVSLFFHDHVTLISQFDLSTTLWTSADLDNQTSVLDTPMIRP